MDATSLCAADTCARQYLAVDSQQVRAALRQLRTDANMTPEEFADDAGVSRATVYRIEDLDTTYAPRIETVSLLVESRGLTLSEFFARIEGLPAHAVSETLPPPAQHQQDSHGSSNPVPLDDTNAIIALNTAAITRLVRLGEQLVGELRAAREQAASARAAASARHARRRKTG